MTDHDSRITNDATAAADPPKGGTPNLFGDRAVWGTYVEALRPPPALTPAAFTATHRKLHAVYCSERPGVWDATTFPWQAPAINCVQEAMKTGKRGICLMKAGQIGGTDCMINGGMWLKVYHPGPQLFMTSTEKVASEFGRERFALIIPDMEPVAKKYLPNKRGDILTKRFTDGKIQLSGGQSVFNLQSTPYRFVTIDELDSLVENLGGEGDPVKLAEVRMDSFTGQTLMLAYAHPTTRERGVAKIYYEQSDQRRGFVRHACGQEFYLQWEHVKVVPEYLTTENTETQRHGDGGGDGGTVGEKGELETMEAARLDASRYHYICPGCGSYISDGERALMVRSVTYKSILPPAIAAKKTWIGLHASQLYSPGKTIKSLAQRFIDCGTDDNALRVFTNKVLGEDYAPNVADVSLEAFRRLIVVRRRQHDPEFYLRGTVPPGVRFLTAGQDTRVRELHYAVWGWGLRRGIEGHTHLCGWLIDWGVIARPYNLVFEEAEFHVFDDLIYRRQFPATKGDRVFVVKQCGHDTSYEPTQTPLTKYCMYHPHRAIPIKGAALTATSATNAPYARWGTPLGFKVNGKVVKDERTRPLLLNTFMLKTDFYGWVSGRREDGEGAAVAPSIEIPDVLEDGSVAGVRRVKRLTLPEDVDEWVLEQSKNEKLVAGKKKGEMVWKKTGPNHIADCNIYSYGLALHLDPFQQGRTDEEARAAAKPKRTYEDVAEQDEGGDPSMG